MVREKGLPIEQSCLLVIRPYDYMIGVWSLLKG